ncbi:hypothetical protein BT96DRAFT_985769 [Gymnopus androsaceus JB14]|uniref:Uncharacterized protein n=1 Tax=Gymnopus androsaceus JB14 TaxID=1447944 RepID=A0A6A4ICY2_9AGAR|nr:hypothetical protein BT96DRAFT_985769 [Gymnopus androsaceus JB14]
MAGISLTPANVNAIDMKERHGSILGIQRTPVKQQNVTKANLPLSTTTDLRKWDTEFMPTIIDFVGAQEFQFGMSTQPNPHLPKRNRQESYDDVKECAIWVAIQLHEDNWAYNSPGHTRATSSDAMRGSMILETFAYHSEPARTFKAKSKSGFSAGALALSAAVVRLFIAHSISTLTVIFQVLRALCAHTPGYDSIKYARQVEDVECKKEGKSRPSRNTKDSFGDAPWSDFVSIYFRLLSKANDAK